MDLRSPPNSQKDTKVRQQAIRSIKWTALAQLLPRLITPLTTMVLAYLLVPDDFGIVAIATLVISFANIIVGMGLGATVIQQQTRVEDAAYMAFWMNLSLAIVMYVILWILSPIIADFYNNEALTNVLRIVGISLIISAFSTIPTALLQKELMFKKIFLIGAIPQIINGVISLVFAFLGFGYWSLVIGNLTGNLISSILAVVLSQWKPRLIWRPEIAKSIFNFSFWVLLSSFASWFYLYADNAIAGYYFGANGLGQYSLGFNISMLLPGMIAAPIASIAYPVFCKINDQVEVGKELLRFQSLSASLLFPLCVGLSAISTTIVSIIYGNKWPELGITIQVLSLMPGMLNIWSLNADAFRAVGRPELWTQVSILSLLLLLPLLFTAGDFGLREFVLARSLGAIAVPVLCILVAKKFLFVTIKNQIKNITSPLLSSIVMLIFLIYFSRIFSPFSGFVGVIQLLFISAIGGAIYFFTLRLLNRKLFEQIFRLGKKAIYSRGDINP